MHKTKQSLLISVFPILLFAQPAVITPDLSKYRTFQFGENVATVTNEAGEKTADVKVMHSRPVLMQQLSWHPQRFGSSPEEPAKNVVLDFYDGKLIRITVEYDRFSTEGMSVDDMIQAISAVYGKSTNPIATTKTPTVNYSDQEEVVARWQDQQFHFELMRATYGSSFRLIGNMKKFERQAQAAVLEATRLEDKEAPQKEAERVTRQNEAERVRLEEVRLVNKPKFQP